MHFQSKIVLTHKSDEALDKKFFNKIEINSEIDNFLNFEIRPLENKSSIGVEQVSELSGWVYRKSDLVKIAIIYQSELLTNEAQNSLLKLLEEPSPNTVLILVTNNRNRLLETILSRCSIYNYLEVENNDFDELINGIINCNNINTYADFEKQMGQFENRKLVDTIDIFRKYLLENSAVLEQTHKLNMIELLEKLEFASQNRVSDKQILMTLFTFITSIKYI